MDEKTEILISIGAAAAVNCIPCYEHLYFQAKSQGLNDKEILEAVDIAVKVKNGAHVAIKSSMEEIMGDGFKRTVSDTETCPCDCDC